MKPLGFSEDTDLYRRGASFLALAPVLPALPAHAEEVGVPITEIASGSLVNQHSYGSYGKWSFILYIYM